MVTGSSATRSRRAGSSTRFLLYLIVPICRPLRRRARLTKGRLLGRVTRVEARRVLVTLTDEEAVQRATVSALVALHAGDGFLMGIIDTLVCSETSDRVIAHLMPVGAFHPAAGGGGTFRVGAAHQPRIHAGCYLVEGEDLRRLMGCIADDVSPDERLILGRYGDNDGAEAVANGNRMFQRHLAILGNSGAGKSWAVALLLERAARLQNASLIVLDLHGEYGPLADGGIATRLRLGGPADFVDAGDDLMYLPYWIFEIDELALIVLNADDPQCGRSALVANPADRGDEAWVARRGRRLRHDDDRDGRFAGSLPDRASARVCRARRGGADHPAAEREGPPRPLRRQAPESHQSDRGSMRRPALRLHLPASRGVEQPRLAVSRWLSCCCSQATGRRA